MDDAAGCLLVGMFVALLFLAAVSLGFGLAGM